MDQSQESVLSSIISSLEEKEHKQQALKNKEIFEKYLPLIHSDVWTLSAESEDKSVQSYFSKTDEGKVMAKGVGLFPFKPSKVQHFYNKAENRPLFDSEFLEQKELLKIENKQHNWTFLHVYAKRKGYSLVKPRDYIMSALLFQLNESLYAVGHSIDLSDYPPSPDCVRSDIDFVINEFAPGPENKGCRFTRTFRAQPGGMIPQVVADAVIKRSGMDLLQLRKAMLE